MKCKDCKHWRQFENDPNKGVCACPERHDEISVHYNGHIKAGDYCMKWSNENNPNGWRLTHDD